MEIATHYLIYLYSTYNSNDQWRFFNMMELDHREKGKGKRTIFRYFIFLDRRFRYDQSKMTLRLAISWEPRAKQTPTDLLTSLPLASRWIIPGSIHCHSVINNFNFRVQYLIYALNNFFSSFSSAAMNETTQPVCLFKLFRLGFLLLYYSYHPRKNKFKINIYLFRTSWLFIPPLSRDRASNQWEGTKT